MNRPQVSQGGEAKAEFQGVCPACGYGSAQREISGQVFFGGFPHHGFFGGFPHHGFFGGFPHHGFFGFPFPGFFWGFPGTGFGGYPGFYK